MSTNMQTFSLTVEPDLFNQVLEKVDKLRASGIAKRVGLKD